MVKVGVSHRKQEWPLPHWLALPRCRVMNEQPITCKRGSAKHSVKDDHAFLWKHAIFMHLPSQNPSIDQDEILHDL
jgi:hypothetical protein